MYAPDKRTLIDHLKALAHPVRLRILEMLAEADGELSVSHLVKALRMSQPRVSWHLALLRRGGVVRQRREGRQVLCSLDSEAIRRCQRMLWEVVSPRKTIRPITD